MATSMAQKRSSRLNTRDLSAKAVPGKRLRSRKVITPNEDSPKVKVATRTKQLCAIIKDVSPTKYESTKLYKGSSPGKSSKMKKVKMIKKSLGEKEQEEKKTSKRRKNVVISSNINTNKRRISIKERKATNNSIKQHQMTLEESFKYQSLSKRLRPRRNKVNYCDDSKLLQQHLPSKHQDSIVMLERVDSDNTRKVPVYKTTRTFEPSLEDKNNIYDFKYDADDTKEKLAKKKKKRNIKIKSKKIKKNVHKKDTVEIKTIDDGADKSDSDTDYPVENARCKSPVESAAAPTPLPKPTKEDIIEVSKVDASVHIVEETSLSDKPPDKLSVEQSEKQDVRCKETKIRDVRKPRIVSIENADNISIVKATPGSNQDILPFRPSSNILNNRPMIQYRNTSNSSLLIKSLSPISKEYDIFDPGSPWRPPQLPYVFSRSKHFIQSTPNVTKMDTIHKKRLMQVKDDSCNVDKVANASDIMSKNTNSPVQNMSDNKVGYKKNPNPCRKFGTEITNIDHLSNCSTIQVSNIEVISEKQPAAETETNTVTNVPLDTIAPPSPNPPSFDDTDDKENVAANHQTPKKSTKKKLKKRHFPNSSPLKACENKGIMQSENVDPQPGPSGMRDAKNCDEQKIFRQSNLNNFLNLIDMPENTRINTRHGIFDDAHSSPVSSSAIKSTKPTIGELKNAFGFCENDTELDTPSKSELAINQASNKIRAIGASKPLATPTPAKLPLRELRNNLIQKKQNKNADYQQTTKQKNVEVSKPPEVKKDNRLVDVVNFSDTFDVLSESGRLSSCDVPLFIDLEPSHFSKPAQHSYKRKRAVTFNFSDDSGKEEDEEENVKKHTKKKKLTKSERENEKRLNEWVKTVNNTFQEIDEYDLLIE